MQTRKKESQHRLQRLWVAQHAPQRAELGRRPFLRDSGGAGAERGESHRTSAFTDNELHPLTTVLTAQPGTPGQNLFSSLSAKLSHLGRPLRLQLSDCSTAHLSFGGCFYPKCPADPQVFTFLARCLGGEWNPSPLQRLCIAKLVQM